MPAFGFSIGDVIATIELIRKLLGACKSTTGATAHYQRTIIELESLGRILRDVGRVSANDIADNTARIDSLRAVAFATSLTLRDFLQRLQKYEASLFPASQTHRAKRITKAMQWTLNMDEEVDKLQLYVASQLLSINTQLQMLEREASSRRDARRSAEHEYLSRVMHSHSYAVQNICTKISSMANESDRHRRAVESLAGHSSRNTRLLVDLSQSIIRGPPSATTDTITLHDPLGRRFPLPYTYFQQWELFDGFIKHVFSEVGLPGSIHVKHGSFVIFPTSSDDKALTKSNWTSNVFPGAALAMTIVLTMLKLPIRQCPRPSCGYQISDITETETFTTCPKCELSFRFNPDVKNLGLAAEDDKLQLAQQDDDLDYFGRRPRPADVIEIQSDDEQEVPAIPAMLTAMPSGAQELSADNLAALETASTQHIDDSFIKPMKHSQLTPIYKIGSGEGMDSWLNFSVMPAHEPQPQSSISDTLEGLAQQTRQERKDIEALKRVHLVSKVPESQPLKDTVKEYQDMPLDAQIYLRKVIDRFPQMSPFLAKRFADANVRRLSRLRLRPADEDVISQE